jgi:hypothetical protein
MGQLQLHALCACCATVLSYYLNRLLGIKALT